MTYKPVTQRLFGKTVIDSLELTQNAFYIDGTKVTVAATTLNNAITPAAHIGQERITVGTIDFSAATAVDTDLGAIGFKGTVIQAFIQIDTATNKDTTLSISKAATAGTKLTGDYALTAASTTYPNVAGAVVGVAPSATPTFAATDHFYLYAPAVTGRTAGKAYVTIISRITA